MSDIKLISDLKKSLPETLAIIGYGSGFFKQAGYATDAKPDKDMILVVDNLYHFLAQDYAMNPEHFYPSAERKYKRTKRKSDFFYHKLGCLKFQKDNYRFKLLIVEREALLYDVLTWEHFGIAARLSKPIFYDQIPEDIERAIMHNRKNVIITALLSLPEDEITKEKLYKTISGLSYISELRMITHSEKKTKADDIVDGAFEVFEDMYASNSLIEFSDEVVKNDHLLQTIYDLPENLKNYILKKININEIDTSKRQDLESLKKVIHDYFEHTNMINSLLLAYSCCRTLGLVKFANHVRSKRKNAKGW